MRSYFSYRTPNQTGSVMVQSAVELKLGYNEGQTRYSLCMYVRTYNVCMGYIIGDNRRLRQ